MSAPKWAVSMRKLGPGLYIDREQRLHVNAVEIVEELGAVVNEENLRVAEEAARDAVRKHYPDIRVTEIFY